MKTSNWLLLGGGALAAYYLFSKGTQKKSGCNCNKDIANVVSDAKSTTTSIPPSSTPIAQSFLREASPSSRIRCLILFKILLSWPAVRFPLPYQLHSPWMMILGLRAQILPIQIPQYFLALLLELIPLRKIRFQVGLCLV